jgi:GNAT superfamily N-acetyltransferase
MRSVQYKMGREKWIFLTCGILVQNAVWNGEKDGIPTPSKERISEIQKLFLKENQSQKLNFRVALDNNGNIVACAGGLLRLEYVSPLSEDQSLFGWVISVFTLPEYRKKGLASQLVEDVCTWLKDQGARRA